MQVSSFIKSTEHVQFGVDLVLMLILKSGHLHTRVANTCGVILTLKSVFRALFVEFWSFGIIINSSNLLEDRSQNYLSITKSNCQPYLGTRQQPVLTLVIFMAFSNSISMSLVFIFRMRLMIASSTGFLNALSFSKFRPNKF